MAAGRDLASVSGPFRRLVEVIAYGQMDRTLFGHRRRLLLLRYRFRRIKGELRLHQGMLDPGRNLVLLWRYIRRNATAVKTLLLRRHNPDDPFAMVTAPRLPRMPRKSGSVAVDPYEY